MARSYRKPYSSWCGHKHPASRDKRIAARGVRRTQDEAIRKALKEDALEDFLIPDIYECPWNNVYSWVRDGKQHIRFADSRVFGHDVGVALQLEREDLLKEAWESNLEHYRWWLALHRK